MKMIRFTLLVLLALLTLDVYASAKITDHDEIVAGEIPRPAHIWVYDFSATGSDIPAASALAGQSSDNDPVWSKNSCGLQMVVFQQPAQAFVTAD